VKEKKNCEKENKPKKKRKSQSQKNCEKVKISQKKKSSKSKVEKKLKNVL
jgi:hypothetical protein